MMPDGPGHADGERADGDRDDRGGAGEGEEAGTSVGLHAGRPRPARAWGVVRTAVEIARRVDDGRSAGPSSSHAATTTSGSRGALMPTGSPLCQGWNRSRSAARIERVAWWSRDLTVPTGTPTTWAIVASGSPA